MFTLMSQGDVNQGVLFICFLLGWRLVRIRHRCMYSHVRGIDLQIVLKLRYPPELAVANYNARLVNFALIV
jgi:hypothetical protein